MAHIIKDDAAMIAKGARHNGSNSAALKKQNSTPGKRTDFTPGKRTETQYGKRTDFSTESVPKSQYGNHDYSLHLSLLKRDAPLPPDRTGATEATQPANPKSAAALALERSMAMRLVAEYEAPLADDVPTYA
jgi:hypothetical protein